MNKQILQLSDLEKIISTGKFRRNFPKGIVTVVEYSPEQAERKNELMFLCAVLCNRFRWYRPLQKITLLTKTMTSDNAWDRFLKIEMEKNIPLRFINIPIITNDFEIERWYNAYGLLPSEYVIMDFAKVMELNIGHYKHHRIVMFVPILNKNTRINT